eukprot:scaffold7572_cov118-Cylindrotheca_fusiformis.AAC.8
MWSESSSNATTYFDSVHLNTVTTDHQQQFSRIVPYSSSISTIIGDLCTRSDDLTFCHKLMIMNNSSIEERNGRDNSKMEEVDPKIFVYTSEMKQTTNLALIHLRVDSTVRAIPERAFRYCRALTRVQFPETLRRIDDGAFYSCSNLKSVQFVSNDSREAFSSDPNSEDGWVVFPETIQVIGDSAFAWCGSLRKVVVCSGSTKLSHSAFRYCQGLLSIELPDGLQVIEEYLFYGCESLTAIRIPTSVINIREGAFGECQTLISLELPEKLRRIGKFAFADCSKLKYLRFASEDTLENGSLTVFPETLREIDDGAFQGCQSLWKVIVCSASTKLGCSVFSGCVGLVSIELPEGLEVIEEYLFCGCESLEAVRIPASVINIGEEAFEQCRSLTSLEFLNGVLDRTNGSKSMKPSPTWERIKTFFGCGFQRVDSIHIGDNTFGGCSSLSHVRIPPSVESIGIDAFSDCSSLISIELPEESSFDMNVSGCCSLVSVAGQMSLNGQFSNFARDSKLGRVVDDKADLERRWKHRFDNSPLNKLCYYHSYHSPEDALVQFRSLMEENPLAATRQLDEFGMTPLHVLSLSRTPNLDMMRALIKGGHPDHIVRCRDLFGSTPLDYLCLNRMPNSAEVIRRVLVQMRFSYSLASEGPWKSDSMREAVDEALAVDWSSRRSEMGVVYWKLANSERKDIVSLMELFLWKLKIDEFGLKKEQIANRQNCRTKCGASIVIPHVLSFLGTLDVEDQFVKRYRSKEQIADRQELRNPRVFLVPYYTVGGVILS